MPLENNHSSDPIPEVRLGSKVVGPGKPCYVIAEIGINHNGDIDIAKKLIAVAMGSGCDAVKFQKRTIDVVYTPEELAKEVEKIDPSFGDAVRRVGKDHKLYLACLVLLITAINRCTPSVEVKFDVHVDVNRLIEQVMDKPPASITSSPQRQK